MTAADILAAVAVTGLAAGLALLLIPRARGDR